MLVEQTMSKRNRDAAKRSEARLRLALGSQCCDCHATEALEFDCIQPRGRTHHGLDHPRRIAFYWREARSGNLALRCADCHAAKTKTQNAKALVRSGPSDPQLTDPD